MSIPKVIHYCWFGGKEKPESVMRCIASWRKHCPDYEIKEWNESNLDVTENAYTKQAYDVKAWGFVPDYLRLWIIYNYGGIYLDTDVQVLRSFDELLKNHAFMGFERDTGDSNGMFVNCGQGFGAEQGNDVIAAHMAQYVDLQFALPDGTYNRTPSPHYTTNVLKQFGLDNKRNEIQDLGAIVIYSDDYFCPKSFATGLVRKSKNTYSIHQFDGSWFSAEEQECRRKWERDAKKDYWVHLPNRLLKHLLGESAYQKLKKILGR
ncbi:MAG: glycosyl transferase [Lachnospiraceae bacterium]|nr:glycosyl transferase [Lachnospiraceae bacterium]